jgi:hypothetical protein
MESQFFILLDLDPKPAVPPATDPPPMSPATDPPLVLDEGEVDTAPVPCWQRVIGFVVYCAIELLLDAISTPG